MNKVGGDGAGFNLSHNVDMRSLILFKMLSCT